MFWLGVYRDGIESYTEAFDTDDPMLVNCYSTYATNTDNDGRPSMTLSRLGKLLTKTLKSSLLFILLLEAPSALTNILAYSLQSMLFFVVFKKCIQSSKP
jgi:hypothetical protein